MSQPALYGIVLAGGSARRLSGVDKPMLTIGGIPLPRRVIEPFRDALPAEPANIALHAMLGRLAVTEVRALARQTADVDTEADLRRAREAHGG